MEEGMFYEFTRQELKQKNGTDFKQNDIICVGNFQIEIDYGKEKYDRPSLCSKVFDSNKMKYQDIVYRQKYISEFLHR
jgi:hypothetical protein